MRKCVGATLSPAGRSRELTSKPAIGSEAKSTRSMLAAFTGDRVVRNIGWYCSAEAFARISKLATTVVLARMLGPVDFGVAAIAITVFELVRVIANHGISQMVIRASAADLDATCNTAFRANLIVCTLAAALHVLAGAVIARISGRPELFGMIALLGLVYILMIPSLMPVYLLLRRGAVRSVAFAGMAHVIADNVLTIGLALCGFGAWAVVLPRLLSLPVWIIAVRRRQSWTFNPAAGTIPLARMARFAVPVIASEMLGAMRLNLDKIIVWSVLGIEALGIYYFAFNAGIGLSLSLTSALNNSLYPELARLAGQPRRMLRRFDRALIRSALPITGLIGLQAALAFVYVPLVFGARWENEVALVALLCCSALTKPYFDAATQLLRASGQPLDEVAAATIYTVLTLGMFTGALLYGLVPGIVTLAVSSLVFQALFAVWARRKVQARIHSDGEPQAASTDEPGHWVTT